MSCSHRIASVAYCQGLRFRPCIPPPIRYHFIQEHMSCHNMYTYRRVLLGDRNDQCGFRTERHHDSRRRPGRALARLANQNVRLANRFRHRHRRRAQRSSLRDFPPLHHHVAPYLQLSAYVFFALLSALLVDSECVVANAGRRAALRPQVGVYGTLLWTSHIQWVPKKLLLYPKHAARYTQLNLHRHLLPYPRARPTPLNLSPKLRSVALTS